MSKKASPFQAPSRSASAHTCLGLPQTQRASAELPWLKKKNKFLNCLYDNPSAGFQVYSLPRKKTNTLSLSSTSKTSLHPSLHILAGVKSSFIGALCFSSKEGRDLYNRNGTGGFASVSSWEELDGQFGRFRMEVRPTLHLA